MKWLWALLAEVVLAAVAGLAVAWSGIYNISALEPHLQPVNWLLDLASHASARRHAAAVPLPPEPGAADVRRGFAVYEAHCQQCHGGPGVAPDPFALGMSPLPTPLVQTGREWSAREIYWVTRNGIKMTGMPAWKYRLTEEDLWAVTAYVQYLPQQGKEEYARWSRQTGGGPP